MAPSNPFTRLPPELLDTIGSHLFDGLDSTEVRRCALVSRTFRGHFQPILFSQLSLSDGSDGLGSHRKASLFFESISRRPGLAQHVRSVVLLLGAGCLSGTIPKILESLPSVAKFFVYSLPQSAGWTQLTPPMKAAIFTITRLASLRSLKVGGFPAIPSTLLRANSQLRELFVANVGVVSLDEPESDFPEQPAMDIPTSYFTTIQSLTSIHSSVLQQQHWLGAAINGSGAMGRLRYLSVIPIFPESSG